MATELSEDLRSPVGMVRAAGCGAVRRQGIDRGPMDSACQDRRANAATARLATYLLSPSTRSLHRRFIDQRKDLTFNEIVEPLAAERLVRSVAAP
ncbi:MAG: hypothetical protein E5W49_21130 [Mesorhizobium sp.]|nr:MAG: hypothetical protein E5W49_21130 [Mesorhizobium sp.]